MILYNERKGPIIIIWDVDSTPGAFYLFPGKGTDLGLIGLNPPVYPHCKLTPARESYIRATYDSHVKHSPPDCPQAIDYQEHMPDVLAELDAIRKTEIRRKRK